MKNKIKQTEARLAQAWGVTTIIAMTLAGLDLLQRDTQVNILSIESPVTTIVGAILLVYVVTELFKLQSK